MAKTGDQVTVVCDVHPGHTVVRYRWAGDDWEPVTDPRMGATALSEAAMVRVSHPGRMSGRQSLRCSRCGRRSRHPVYAWTVMINVLDTAVRLDKTSITLADVENYGSHITQVLGTYR